MLRSIFRKSITTEPPKREKKRRQLRSCLISPISIGAKRTKNKDAEIWKSENSSKMARSNMKTSSGGSRNEKTW